jgi:xylan 1,4-beta-xylosidase
VKTTTASRYTWGSRRSLSFDFEFPDRNYLEPVTWRAGDWTVFGDHGKPVDTWKKPRTAESDAPGLPEISDDFSAAALNPMRQWNRNPVDQARSLTDRRGFLRLTALPAESLSLARNTLTQKLWDEFGVIDMKLEAAGMGEGQRAGLAFESGPNFDWVAVEKSAGALRIVWPGGTRPEVRAAAGLWLQGEYRHGKATLLYSLDGKTWPDTGRQIALKFASWKRARFGCFSYGPNGGYADLDYAHYRYLSAPLP